MKELGPVLHCIWKITGPLVLREKTSPASKKKIQIITAQNLYIALMYLQVSQTVHSLFHIAASPLYSIFFITWPHM